MKVLAESGSGESPLPGSQMVACIRESLRSL